MYYEHPLGKNQNILRKKHEKKIIKTNSHGNNLTLLAEIESGFTGCTRQCTIVHRLLYHFFCCFCLINKKTLCDIVTFNEKVLLVFIITKNEY